MSPGVLTISAPLSRELTNWYNLTIMVSYGVSGSGDQALSDTATIYVNVLDTNEFGPSFIGGPTLILHVTEGAAMHHALQVWQLNFTSQNHLDSRVTN
jgi:hypothetical protein